MNTKNTLIIGILILAIIGGIAYSRRTASGTMEKTDMTIETTLKPEDTTVMEKKDSMTSVMETPDAMMKKETRYVDYTQNAFDSAKGKKRVYFFHASWCPTCKVAHTEVLGNLEGVPGDVMLFKTDYDTNSALKKQYGITYQHTFVLVDDMGKERKKWNGGGLKELVTNTK